MAVEYSSPDIMEVKVGTPLYVGILKESHLNFKRGYAWMATDEKDARIYGDVYAFTVIRPLKLIDTSTLRSHQEMNNCFYLLGYCNFHLIES
jgi:hypothetical protein